MDKIAFLQEGTFVYWSSMILTLAAATAICFFLAFYIGKGGNAVAGFTAVPMALVLGLVCSRFFHWYFRIDTYDSFSQAMTDYSVGGFALMGCFLGAFLTAWILRLVRLHRSLGEMLDCMAIAGSAGIAVGRLASFFNASDRGQVVQSLRSLPFVYPVTNMVSGAQEYRLATFVIQAMVAFGLFVMLTIFYIRGSKRERKDGDTCLIFLLLYCASQVVLDSTRYDSLFFRSNGFVSVTMVLSAIGLALVIVLFSRRMVKAMGFRFWQGLLWILIAAAMGGAGFMEYYVQRRGNEAVFAYSVMSGCLAGIVVLTLLIRFFAVKAEQNHTNSVG